MLKDNNKYISLYSGLHLNGKGKNKKWEYGETTGKL